MASGLLNSKDAAAALGVSVATLYDWLSQSDAGEFKIRGDDFSISYFQGGRNGQGRIQISEDEVERIREAMRCKPTRRAERRKPIRQTFPGIHVPLGRPK